MTRQRGKHLPRRVWTAEDVRALGVQTDIKTCASVLGVSDRTAYELVRRGEFPFPVRTLGNRYVIPTEPIAEWLCIKPDAAAPQGAVLAVVRDSPEAA